MRELIRLNNIKNPDLIYAEDTMRLSGNEKTDSKETKKEEPQKKVSQSQSDSTTVVKPDTTINLPEITVRPDSIKTDSARISPDSVPPVVIPDSISADSTRVLSNTDSIANSIDTIISQADVKFPGMVILPDSTLAPINPLQDKVGIKLYTPGKSANRLLQEISDILRKTQLDIYF